MKKEALSIFLFAALVLTVASCVSCSIGVTELRHFPIDSMEGIITQSGVRIDKEISSDGNGSLQITATEPTVVQLFEIDDLDIDNARLIYQARVRSQNIEGKVYLEMLCSLPGKSVFFSRGLDSTITGTTNWKTKRIPFFLKTGENPDNVKLNLVIDGSGTIWIDDIRLLQAPYR